MSIKVDTYQMQSKAAYASTLANQLETAARQLDNLYYNLDAQVKSRRGIGSTMRNLEQRIEKSQQKMYNISKYLTKAATDYSAVEALVVAKSARLGAVGAITAAGSSMAQIGTGSGTAGGKVEGKKWYQSNWLKIAVGAVVVGAAVAVAIVASPAIAAIATAAAVGGAIGGIVGGITSGISSAKNGGKFIDGFADGFMWGAVGGTISGAIGATGVGLIGGALAEGAVNTAIYAGQTLYNGGEVTATGLATSFVVAAGFSALGGLASKKISKFVKDKISNADEVSGALNKPGIGKLGEGIPLDEVKPEVLQKIHPDDNAVYGYSPNEGTPYAEYDFTDIDKVTKNRAIREKYLEQSKEIQKEIDKMVQQSTPKDEIAETVVNMRNQDKIAARAKMSPDELAPIEARNIELYGDPVGPTKEYLFNECKKQLIKKQLFESDEQVWDMIIRKSMKKDDILNTLLGIKH